MFGFETLNKDIPVFGTSWEAINNEELLKKNSKMSEHLLIKAYLIRHDLNFSILVNAI